MGRPCRCCQVCPYCDLQDIEKILEPTPAEAQLGVSGLLLGAQRVKHWFDIPFASTPFSDDFPEYLSGQCDQSYVSFGSYDSEEIQRLLASAISCTFDGLAVKEGSYVCFFSDEQQKKLSAIAVGPVIVNNIIFEGVEIWWTGSSYDGTFTTDSQYQLDPYTMHWASMDFIKNAKSMKVCPFNGQFGGADIMFLPEELEDNPLP